MTKMRSGRFLPCNGSWSATVVMSITACGCLIFVNGARAQDVLAPAPVVFSTAPPVVTEIQSNSSGFIDFGNATPAGALQEKPFQVGPLDLHPHFSYQFLYATGVQFAPGSAQDTITQNVSPGLLVDIGRNWALDYTPTWTTYSSREFHDTWNHAATLNGVASYNDWLFGFSQTYNRSDSPLIVTGGQTLQQIYVTTLTGSYRFNTVLSMDLSAGQNFTYTEHFTNTREWSTTDWLNYQFWPELDGSLGIGGGYDNVSVGVDSSFEQYQARVSWRATQVTSVVVHGGAEDRQFLGSSGSDLLSPIFGATIRYAPFPSTAIALDADRSVTVSPFLDEVIEATDVTAMLNQRLLGKLFLNAGGGYHWDTYRSASSVITTSRRDENYTLNASLTCVFLKRATASATYQYSENLSTQGGFGFSSNQYGFQLGYQY
ncbi:MAG TPA: outer membrane beta-barrel protein [Verrucomicrobiae bacterium]|nr:outer membrane beta-barrel protein [Verrucomicrobiae bacterium]